MKILKNIFFALVLATCVGNSFASEGLLSNEPKIKFVQCYPNPATANVNFDFTAVLDKGYTLTIYNFIGKKVEEIKLINTHNTLNLENYYRGLYIYQLINKQGKLVESGKFQVVK